MPVGPLKKYEYRGVMLSASQIAIQSGLSLPTVLRRIRAGVTGNDLGAPARTVELPAGSARFDKSDAVPTAAQARQYMRRAQQRYDKTGAILASAIQRRELPYEIDRLRSVNAKAEMNVAYWRETARQAEVRETAEPMNLASSTSPAGPSSALGGRLCPCCGQRVPEGQKIAEAAPQPSNSILGAFPSALHETHDTTMGLVLEGQDDE